MYKLGIIMIICFFSVCGFAQPNIKPEKFEKASIKNSLVFKGNITEVWDYLSDLGNLQNLVPSTIKKSITEGKGIGSIVTLSLQNNGKIVEKITTLNPKKHLISYTMIETPLPIQDYLATFSIITLPNEQLKVTFKARFSVQKANRKQRLETFNNLQLELLENLKKIKGKK